MEATIQLAFIAARLDGPPKAEAIALIREHIRQRFAYNPSLHNHAKGFLAHYETAPIDREKCLRSILDLCATEHRAILLQLVEHVMTTSGKLTPSGRICLANWRSYLGLPETAKPLPSSPASAKMATKNASAIKGQEVAASAVPPTDADFRSLLEIDPSFTLSADLVRRHYQLLSERFAPEKVQAMGAEVIATVARKRDLVRTAAEALLAKMGEKLAEEVDQAKPKELRENPDLDNVFGA
jgi:hypothetical protein